MSCYVTLFISPPQFQFSVFYVLHRIHKITSIHQSNIYFKSIVYRILCFVHPIHLFTYSLIQFSLLFFLFCLPLAFVMVIVMVERWMGWDGMGSNGIQWNGYNNVRR